MKVHALEDGSACGYYRIRVPFDQMRAEGLDVSYARHGNPDPDVDVFVGQRVGNRDSLLAWLKLWRDHKLVWETDDDLWTVDPTNVRAAKVFTEDLLSYLEPVVRVSHMVTVSSEPLAEAMRRFNDNVHVIPNHIDGALLDVERPRRDRVTVGWAGGDSHERDLEMVKPHLRRFFDRNPDVDLHTIGWGSQRAPHEFPKHMRASVRPNPLHTLRLPYRHSGWSPKVTDYYSKIDFDIGLAPLVPSVFNRSKSAIKALEYAALGIPVIASDVGPYQDFVEDGVTGFLVRRDHEWCARLRDLTNDADMREAMGAAAKEKAKAWTIQNGWKLWADAYATLA